MGTIVVLLCLAPIAPARGEPLLRVDYDPPRLSVEAREVTLLSVLGEIGARAGFSVEETAPASTLVTLSMRNASLDDVLRQLLRLENSTVLYRKSEDSTVEPRPLIDRIVLSGEPSAIRSGVASAGGYQLTGGMQGPGPDGPSQSSPPPVATSPLESSSSVPVASGDLGPAPDSANEPGTAPMTVGDVLRAHAVAGIEAAQQPASTGTPASQAVAPPPQSDLQAALAETTRRAQQALGVLVDGLGTATRSLQRSLATGGK